MQPYLPIYHHTRPYTGVCLYTIIAFTISDTFRLLDFMTYPFPTRRDTQSMREISYGFENTDCISEVSWYVYSIEVNGNRWFRADSRGQSARDASPHLRTRNRPHLTATDCKSKEAWYVHPIEFNNCRDNSELIPGQPARRRVSDQRQSELIPEANEQGDASATKSVEVNCNERIIRELEGYQSRHQ